MVKKKRKGIKKRYLITVSSIMLAILSVLLLRTFDKDFDGQKNITEKEIKAIMEFNKELLQKPMPNKSEEEKVKVLRNEFANKISYKKLFNSNEDFRNFKYLPNKTIYGLQLLNNAHVGFYYNNEDCGNLSENKDYCAGVLIDVNGYTRPNQFGEDQFLLKIYKDVVVE